MSIQPDFRSLLSYDPETGEFRWLVKRTRNLKANVGDLAGGVCDNGYIRMMVGGRKYRAHRLAFLFMGRDMPQQVDHINGNRTDNRWCNLRAADPNINAKNARKRKDGNTPVTGIGYVKRLKKWRVRVNHCGKPIYLGIYSSLEDAMNARAAANGEYGFHENHGRLA
jgi:hypothetical protein